MKAGYDARVRAREEKAREREEKEQAEREEERERQHDLEAWSQKTRREQEVCRQRDNITFCTLTNNLSQRLMLKINDRVKNKAALSDRKSAAAQARMKNIASLASEDKAVKKKRKAGPGKLNGRFLLDLLLNEFQTILSELMMRTGRSIEIL